MSDQWAAYGANKGMPEGYQHETVNRSFHFIDPETGANINSNESLWQKFKESHKTLRDGKSTTDFAYEQIRMENCMKAMRCTTSWLI